MITEKANQIKLFRPGAAALRMPWFVYCVSYLPRVKKFEKISVHSEDIIFLGDSITHWVDWQSAFPKIKTHNFGIAGDTSSGVAARLHQCLKGRPAKIFLLIGTNDMFTFQNTSPDKLAENISGIAGRIKNESPLTQIILQSIMPRQRKWKDQIPVVNDRIKNIADQYGACYIDLRPVFDDGSGGLRKEYTYDQLHLNDAGKRAWIKCIRPAAER